MTEVDPRRAGDPILHARADEPWLRPLHDSACDAIAASMSIPESGGFEPEEIFSLFKAWPRASMFAAPTMVKRLVDSGADCPSENIRTIIWGGAPMYVRGRLRALDRFGPRLAQIYGQGESPMTITNLVAAPISPTARIRAGASGSPPPASLMPASK